MTKGDPEGQIFLSYPHANNELFFLLTGFIFYILAKVPGYAEIQFHIMTFLDVLGKIAWVR